MKDSTTDRELLELAAKAADQERSAAGDLWSNARGRLWEPLTDDGDALRLAVKLEIRAACDPVWVIEMTSIGDYERDPYAATRRAIVRAAAQIGRSHHAG